MTGTSSAHVHGGGLDFQLDFNTMDPYSFYSGSGGQASLTFYDQNNDSLVIGGVIRPGTEKTSPNFGLNMNILPADGIPVVVASGDGTCRVTTTTASKNQVSGTFHCVKVKVKNGVTVDADGTFSGRLPS